MCSSYYEFRDEKGNIIAMCDRFGIYKAIKDYLIASGLTVKMDLDTGISYVTN